MPINLRTQNSCKIARILKMSMDGQRSAERVPEKKENQAPDKPDTKPQSAETPSPVISPKPNESPAPRQQCRKRYKCVKEEIKYWFEVIAILGGLAGLGLIWLQYSDMTRATDAAVIQSKALLAQSKMMQSQLQEMRETRREDERAWVFSTGLDIKTNSYGERYYVINFKNSGRTPAINAAIFVTQWKDSSQIPIQDSLPVYIPRGIMIGPNEDAGLTGGEIGLTDESAKIVKEGYSYYLAGTVWYDDVFGHHHWSQFCYQIIPYNRIFGWPQHNSCDDAETNQKK